jgi:hypothetical protein
MQALNNVTMAMLVSLGIGATGIVESAASPKSKATADQTALSRGKSKQPPIGSAATKRLTRPAPPSPLPIPYPINRQQ